jgi:hypothetical protein
MVVSFPDLAPSHVHRGGVCHLLADKQRICRRSVPRRVSRLADNFARLRGMRPIGRAFLFRLRSVFFRRDGDADSFAHPRNLPRLEIVRPVTNSGVTMSHKRACIRNHTIDRDESIDLKPLKAVVTFLWIVATLLFIVAWDRHRGDDIVHVAVMPKALSAAGTP